MHELTPIAKVFLLLIEAAESDEKEEKKRPAGAESQQAESQNKNYIAKNSIAQKTGIDNGRSG